MEFENFVFTPEMQDKLFKVLEKFGVENDINAMHLAIVLGKVSEDWKKFFGVQSVFISEEPVDPNILEGPIEC